MDEHLPRAIPTSIKSILQKAFAEASLEDIHRNFYQSVRDDTEVFDQGNGIESLPFANLPTSKVDLQPSLVISNSCDTTSSNKSMLSPRCTYCVVKKISSLEDMLINKAKIQREKVENFIRDIKSQRVTDMVYLPNGSGTSEELVAMLSFSTSADVAALTSVEAPSISFTLSQNALYLLLTKLSIHYLRFGDIQP